MNKTLLIFTGLISALAVVAAPEESVTKSATGTTSAAVYFEPGPAQGRLVVADVTSDKAASLLSWRVGGVQVVLLKAAANNVTNLSTTVGTLSTNNLVSVTAAGTVTAHTGFSSTLVTNRLVTLHNPIGTNLAVGDNVREVTSTYSTLAYPVASNANLYFVNAAQNWAANDVALVVAPTLTVSNVVATYTTNTVSQVPVGSPLPFDLAYATSVREIVTTNTALLLTAAAADATSLHVSATNGFLAGAVIAVRRQDGAWLSGTIDAGGVSTTNITLATAIGALSVGDLVVALRTNEYTIARPGIAGEGSLVLNNSTGLAARDTVLAIATPYVWPVSCLSTGTALTTYTMTFDNNAAALLAPGTRIYSLTTNTYALTFSADDADTGLVLDGSTGLAGADQIVIMPDTGGAVVRQISTTAAYVYQSQNLAAVTGLALAAGDRLFALGTAVTTPVGAATLRLMGDPVRVLPAGLPGVLSIDGTSACSINAATVEY